jgi:hypothetical protein
MDITCSLQIALFDSSTKVEFLKRINEGVKNTKIQAVFSMKTCKRNKQNDSLVKIQFFLYFLFQ